MTENPAGLAVEAASVTDRGLSEKRPQNEDSMLCDPARRIFAVADGVGGAQAGEVASQTAIEVLTEAFTNHGAGEDAEDLMEIAIQRANDAIYKLSREQPKFAMMATTIVALHLEGSRATVGHVGDSRLYRMTPDGRLRRETDDHSLVEEEVRAGRMTPEQALSHPGRNVISRALGAEAAVEVDLRTFDIENGTLFLLCSDGITRHLPDEELSSLLRSTTDLEETCAEMKRLCYERGAEDNLTAVLVRVGGDASIHKTISDEEPTLIRERATDVRTARASSEASAAAASSGASSDADSARTHDGTLLRRPFDAGVANSETSVGAVSSSNVRADERKKKKSSSLAIPVSLVLVLGAAALAFYVGMMYERKGLSLASGNAANDSRRTAATEPTPAAAASASPTPAAANSQAVFESRRAAVDLSPASEIERMKAQTGGDPMMADDPELLYLYGRALLLVDRQQDAVRAFDLAIQKTGDNMTARNGELKIDAMLAKVAAQVRGGDPTAANNSARELDGVIRSQQSPQQQTGADGNVQPTPGATP
ncbi:MAG TPA: PP2C family serine/threonine-protein phosphatase [Pyrinomonadaceae bacterium]|jgi:protein phosphatase|nr:PP2C family serine/threonine-protein phosphatase [Pyrinomonadaceae bacterium]